MQCKSEKFSSGPLVCYYGLKDQTLLSANVFVVSAQNSDKLCVVYVDGCECV